MKDMAVKNAQKGDFEGAVTSIQASHMNHRNT